jgi:hypothetical protein
MNTGNDSCSLVNANGTFDGTSFSYAMSCTGSNGDKASWSRPTISVSGWGNNNSADCTVTWSYPGSSTYAADSGTVTVALTED